MSEMSAEKKKEIEKHIIKSYFGGGKNVESFGGGVDVITGTDDGRIPHLIVEVTYFGGSGVVMINWDVYEEPHGTEWKNSFAMRVCREREIEQNRCDSVDSMVYAWEAWKSRILNKPIFLETNEKDKRIEELEKEISEWKHRYDDVSVRNEKLEKEVKGLRAEKEVMERHIQELESQNVSIAETNKDKNHIEFLMYSMVATHKPCQENTEITINGTSPGHDVLFAPNPFDIPCDVVVVPKKDFERLQTENEQLKKKVHEYDPMPESKDLLKQLYSIDDVEELEWVLKHTCGGMCSANGWRSISSFWKKNYETLSKLVGFSSVEEVEDYLVNEAECDTLREAISKLHDDVKYTSDEWASANRRNNSWKAAAECNSPKELIEKLNLLRDDISGRSTVIESYKREIEKWREETGCPSPSAAKKLINGLENAVRLTDTTMLNELESNIDEWQKATGRISPEEAKQYIDRLKGRLNKIHDCAVDW